MKKKTTHKRKRRIVHHKPVHTKRRTRRRTRKGMGETMLAELFNPATAHAAAMNIGAGALGGMIAGAANRILTKQNTVTRYGVEIGASFITYAVLGYPAMSAGMAGAFAALESTPVYNKFLAEDDENIYANPDSLNELPMMLNENGETITLQEDAAGNMVYLNENTGETTLAEDVYLEEGTYLQEDDSIYPTYSVEYN
jgi:hypothetical protein